MYLPSVELAGHFDVVSVRVSVKPLYIINQDCLGAVSSLKRHLETVRQLPFVRSWSELTLGGLLGSFLNRVR